MRKSERRGECGIAGREGERTRPRVPFPAPSPETVLALVSWTPHPSSIRSWRGNWTTVGGEGALAGTRGRVRSPGSVGSQMTNE